MTSIAKGLLALLLLSTVGVGLRYSVQETERVKPILSVKETSQGPFAGQKSTACLTILSDGKVKYFRRWNPGTVETDAKTGKKPLSEHIVSVESELTRAELFEVSEFLESDVVTALQDSVVVPASHIDYFESTTIRKIGPDSKEKSISVSDYSTAGLERKSKLPGALIVLMDKIEEIEKEATLKGKTTSLSSRCPEAR